MFAVCHAIQIIESPHCAERVQYRFPRSRKRRIRVKWAARPENFREQPLAFRAGNTIICHPAFAARLRRELRSAVPGPRL